MSTMNTKSFRLGALAVATTGVARAGDREAVETLLSRIQDKDENVRSQACETAGQVGAEAVRPLALTMDHAELEVARAAGRALWSLVRHVGRPGADAERTATARELVNVLRTDQPERVRHEVLWMLSEIGGDEAVPTIADSLSDPAVREDARMALQRIPGDTSLAALERAFKSAPVDFKANLAQSLRSRGMVIAGPPCEKLIPTKKTEMRPIGR